jgi:hypothetical protein
MIYKNYFIFGIIIIIAICLFYRHKNNIESFKPKIGLQEAGALNEWNQNAAAYLCELPLDKTNTKETGFITSFCNRMIREKDYNSFSFLAHDKTTDGPIRNLIQGNKTYKGMKIHYGKTDSDKFIKYPKKYIPTPTIEYHYTNATNCEILASKNEKAIGFITKGNGQPGCWLKEKMGTSGKPTDNNSYNTYLRGTAIQFSYSMWLKIDVVDPKLRCIAIRSKVKNGKPNYSDRRPGMWIAPNQTAFHFRLSTTNYWNDGLNIESGKIPFQKFVHICYTVNGRKIKAYVNGNLEKEKILSSDIPQVPDNLPLFLRPEGSGGFQIAKFRVFPLAIPQKLISSVLMKETPNSNNKFNECMKRYIGNSIPTSILMRSAAKNCNDTGYSEFKHRAKETNYRLIQIKDKKYLPEEQDGSRPPSYKIHNGIVYLSGKIINMRTTGPIGWLPIEARPKERHLFTGLNISDDSEVGGRIDITKEGSILVVLSNKNGSFTLDNISYPLTPGNLLKFEIPLLCHYVKIFRPGSGVLSVAEVQVFDQSNTNIALNKDTNQSSDGYAVATSDKAVDGNTNTQWKGKSMTHTKRGNDNYLEINLGGGFKVKKVVVFNRKDCCSERIAGAKIILLDRKKKEITYKIWDPNDYKKTDKLTRTPSGRTCQNWQKQRPHKHGRSTPVHINGGAGGIIDRYSIYSKKYYHSITKSGNSGGGRSFWWNCPSGIKSYKYNPWGWWGKYSNYGGIGNVKCEDGSKPRGERRSYVGRRPYITKNISKSAMSRKHQIGDHNYARNFGSGNLWCYTTDPRVRWEYVKVDGKKVKSIKEKIYPAQKTFNFNMRDTVPTGFTHYGSGYTKASCKKVGDYVYLSGLLKHKTSPLVKDKIIDQLEVQYRPRYRKIFNVSCNKCVIRVDILTDGKIIFVDTKDDSPVFKSLWIPLDGIRYKINDEIEITLENGYTPYSGMASLNSGIIYRLNKFTRPLHTHSFSTHGNSTIAMWIRPNRNGRQNPYFAGYAGEGAITIEPSGYINFYYGPGYHNRGKYQGLSTKSKIEFGEWTHIAIVKDLRNKKLIWYINGTKNNETRAKYDRAGYRSWGQQFGAGYVNKYSGKMEGIRVYNRPLSTSEIKSLISFSRGTPPNYGPPMISEKNGLVSLSGVASIRKVNEYLANLGEIYRPNRDLYFHTNQNDNAVKVHITQTGDLNINNVQMDEGFITLDGIMYMKNK